jgi:hypothetical protein
MHFIFPTLCNKGGFLQQTTENQIYQWNSFWQRTLPTLALAGPLSLFTASLFVAFHVGMLPDKKYVHSSYEGFIITLGAPFFIATFIFLGQTLSKKYFRISILVTVLGILATASLVFVGSMRLIQKAFIDSGFDSNNLWAAWDNVSYWHMPLLLQNISAPIAFIIAGIALLKTSFAPKWSGILLIVCFPTIATAELFTYGTEILWPLGTAFLTTAIWGIIRSARKNNKAVPFQTFA